MKNFTACDPQNISLYLEDALSPGGETAVEQHLDTCAECRQQIATQAGSGDQWADVTMALRLDDWDDEHSSTRKSPAWPLALLGPTDDPCMLGRIGPFEVSGCVGVGGMGVVFKARDPALDRFAAVKVLSPQLAASETARIRFAREAKAAAAVVHDNVIAVHQVAEYQGLPYLVMPYVPGPSLEERIRRHGPMPVVDAIRIARQVAAGLKAAHAQGLIHRDIKPANILLSGDTERAVITDFGLARAADDATLTRSGSLAGTPQFMAPEQARGEPADTKSDLFSLGALLFAMLTGSPAVANLSGAETVRQVSSQPPPPLESVCADVPKWLQRLMASLHCFEPSKRMMSAEVTERELAASVAKAGSTPLTLQHRQPTVRWQSHRVLMGTMAVIAMVVCGAWWKLQNDSTAKMIRQSGQQLSPVLNHRGAQFESVEAEGPLPQQGLVKPDMAEPVSIEPVPAVTDASAAGQLDLEGEELDQLLNDIDHQLTQLENR